ncbi:radical SAM protein [Candidatus Riflebacteria bacterium]
MPKKDNEVTDGKGTPFLKNYDATKEKKKKKTGKKRLKPIRMPYEGRDVPHIVIEVNQKCNIKCHACYKNKFGYTKPLEDIKEEIDIAISKRNLSVITLAGGEPTLHPELPEVIKYVKSRGIYCQFLSNGLSLTDELLQTYKKAGLNKVYIHIDSLQTRPDMPTITDEKSLHPLREKIGAMVRRNGLNCALAFTLYKKNFHEIQDVVDFVIKSPNYERMLITCCTDFTEIADKFNSFPEANEDKPGMLKPQMVVSIKEIIRVLRNSLGMNPYAYVGSSHNVRTMRWIFYYSFCVRYPGGDPIPFHMQTEFGRLVRYVNMISKKLKGKYPFGRVMSGWKSVLVCCLYALMSFNIKIVLQTIAFLLNLLRDGAEIHQRSFVFQTGPTVNKDGEIEYCRNCPDSTVRNGELVPVCMADFKYPITKTDKS